MNNIIEVTKLNKEFMNENKTKVKALKNIDLSIQEYEFICLLGPSGSGKSTLLRLMEGLIEPSNGEIKIMGENIKGPCRNAGMVFQEYSLMPWKNVLSNVTFGLELKNVKKEKRDKIAINLLDNFGLKDFINSYPYELSGGMKQRVAIARAMATSPEILFMDEPFGALDAYTRFKMQNDLIEFWLNNKMTIVFVTHSVEEALFLGTRIILMSPRPGEIVEDYKIELEYPRNRWNKEFGQLFQKIMDDLDRVSEKS